MNRSQVWILAGVLTNKEIMELEVFEQQHYEYINSEDFFQFMKEMFEYEEKEALSSEENEL